MRSHSVLTYRGQVPEHGHPPPAASAPRWASPPPCESRGGGKRRREYLLSGLVVCAHCGCRYGGNRSDSTNVYYRCTNARHRFPAPRDCFAKQVPAELLELAVTRALVDALDGREAILRFVRQRATPRHALASRARERARIEREVTELASRQTRLLDVYLEGGLSKSRYLQQQHALEQRSSELGERLDEMGRHLSAPSRPDVERSIDHFASLARKRLSHCTPVELRQFLGILIESVAYDWKERLAVVRARLPVVDVDGVGMDSVSPFPGGKAPVDPIAAKFSQEYGLTCHLLRGTNISNFKKYLEGKSFSGSTIRP